MLHFTILAERGEMLAHRELSLLHKHLRHIARAACRFVSHLRFSLCLEHHITLLSCPETPF